MADAPYPLYVLALQADARFAETVKSRTGRDRWTMTGKDMLIPEIREALKAKMDADEHWLTYLRLGRSNG